MKQCATPHARVTLHKVSAEVNENCRKRCSQSNILIKTADG